MLAVGELRDGRTQSGKQILIGLSPECPRTPSTSARSHDFISHAEIQH
jgi:hypothetical protein